MKNIGFIGLGNMGKGMSINLSKSNYNVIGYDIEVNRYKFLEGHNIKFVQNIKSLVEDAEIIITMLPLLLLTCLYSKIMCCDWTRHQ